MIVSCRVARLNACLVIDGRQFAPERPMEHLTVTVADVWHRRLVACDQESAGHEP